MPTERIVKRYNIGQILILDIFLKVGHPSLQYALEEDKGASSDPSPEEQIRDQLGQEIAVGGFSLDPSFQVSQDADIVSVTNTPDGR